MTIEDCIKGEYYTFLRGGGYNDNFTNSCFIAKFVGNLVFGQYIYTGNRYFCPNSWDFKNLEAIKEIRMSTVEEIEHLNSCIKTGKYVEPLEVDILCNLEIW
jgi:hypothetical protein